MITRDRLRGLLFFLFLYLSIDCVCGRSWLSVPSWFDVSPKTDSFSEDLLTIIPSHEKESSPVFFETKELQYHGTTTIAFKYNQSIIVCVDSKASLGDYVGSRSVKKVIPIGKSVVATMAGGAADCSYYIRNLGATIKLSEFETGVSIPVVGIAKTLARTLLESQSSGTELSVGTMIAGYDELSGASLYYVDNSGICLSGNLFAVGSGSIHAYSVLDTKTKEFKEELNSMSKSKAIETALWAVKHATYRDGYSGGYINVIEVNQTGIFHLQRVDCRNLALD